MDWSTCPACEGDFKIDWDGNECSTAFEIQCPLCKCDLSVTVELEPSFRLKKAKWWTA